MAKPNLRQTMTIISWFQRKLLSMTHQISLVKLSLLDNIIILLHKSNFIKLLIASFPAGCQPRISYRYTKTDLDF